MPKPWSTTTRLPKLPLQRAVRTLPSAVAWTGWPDPAEMSRPGVELRGAGERVAAGAVLRRQAAGDRPDRRRGRGQRLPAFRPGPESIQLRLEHVQDVAHQPERRITGGDRAGNRRGQIAQRAATHRPVGDGRGQALHRPRDLRVEFGGGAERVRGLLQARHLRGELRRRVAIVGVLDLQRRVLPQQVGNHCARAPRRAREEQRRKANHEEDDHHQRVGADGEPKCLSTCITGRRDDEALAHQTRFCREQPRTLPHELWPSSSPTRLALAHRLRTTAGRATVDDERHCRRGPVSRPREPATLLRCRAIAFLQRLTRFGDRFCARGYTFRLRTGEGSRGSRIALLHGTAAPRRGARPRRRLFPPDPQSFAPLARSDRTRAPTATTSSTHGRRVCAPHRSRAHAAGAAARPAAR